MGLIIIFFPDNDVDAIVSFHKGSYRREGKLNMADMVSRASLVDPVPVVHPSSSNIFIHLNRISFKS